tara:strand:+ start:5677 stop:5931 length:255 start_codon:yes stop_codon:yes gene_type:complete
MMPAKTKSQLNKLLNFFQKGGTLTAAQAEKKFGVNRMSARVYDLRDQGYCIYGNTKKGSNVVSYRLGTPSREIIRAGFKALRTA